MKFLICFVALLLIIPQISNAFELSPMILEIHGKRGSMVQSEFVIINRDVTEQTIVLDRIDFGAKGNGGSPEFFFNQKTNLSKWIQFEFDRFIIPANSKVTVPFSASIPNDIASGEYRSAIIVSEKKNNSSDQGIGYNKHTALLIFLNIEGNNLMKPVVLDTSIQKNVQMDELPRTMKFRMQNQGNVSYVPQGEIEIRDYFGRVVLKKTLEQTFGKVLPQTTRTYEILLWNSDKKSFWKKWFTSISSGILGPQVVHMKFTNDSQVLHTFSTSFVYINKALIGFLMIITFSIFSFIFLLKKKHSSSVWKKSLNSSGKLS